MTQDRWAAIDFETATREPTSACSLGVALIDNLEVIDTASWLIRPPFNEYEYRNTLVHGIGPDDTELAPEFDEVWWEIRHLLSGRRLLAHNAPFDMRVLRSLIDSRELVAPTYEYACTLSISRMSFPNLPRHTLDTVCDHCGVQLVHHDAASDAEGCGRIAIACSRSLGEVSLSATLGTLGITVRAL